MYFKGEVIRKIYENGKLLDVRHEKNLIVQVANELALVKFTPGPLTQPANSLVPPTVWEKADNYRIILFGAGTDNSSQVLLSSSDSSSSSTSSDTTTDSNASSTTTNTTSTETSSSESTVTTASAYTLTKLISPLPFKASDDTSIDTSIYYKDPEMPDLGYIYKRIGTYQIVTDDTLGPVITEFQIKVETDDISYDPTIATSIGEWGLFMAYPDDITGYPIVLFSRLIEPEPIPKNDSIAIELTWRVRF